MSGRFNLPQGEAFEAAVSAFVDEWNSNHADDQVSVDGGFSKSALAGLAASLTSDQSGPSADAAGDEVAAALSATGVTAPVKGNADIAKVIKAWNAEGAAAGAAQSAPAPAAPASGAASGGLDAARAAAAAKLQDEEAQRAAEVEAETHRYSALDAEFRSQDWFKKKVKRTGWSKPVPGYKPATCPCDCPVGCNKKSQMCCGNSWEDMGWILLCFLCLYSAVGLYFYALLEFNKATDEGHFALYLFVGLIAVFWVGLLTLARSGPAHNPVEEGDVEEAGAGAAADADAEKTTQPLAA